MQKEYHYDFFLHHNNQPMTKWNRLKKKIKDNIVPVIGTYIIINILMFMVSILAFGSQAYIKEYTQREDTFLASTSTHNEEQIKYTAYALTTNVNPHSDMLLANQSLLLLRDKSYSKDFKEKLIDIVLSSNMNKPNYYKNDINSFNLQCGFLIPACSIFEHYEKKDSLQQLKKDEQEFSFIKGELLKIR